MSKVLLGILGFIMMGALITCLIIWKMYPKYVCMDFAVSDEWCPKCPNVPICHAMVNPTEEAICVEPACGNRTTSGLCDNHPLNGASGESCEWISTNYPALGALNAMLDDAGIDSLDDLEEDHEFGSMDLEDVTVTDDNGNSTTYSPTQDNLSIGICDMCILNSSYKYAYEEDEDGEQTGSGVTCPKFTIGGVEVWADGSTIDDCVKKCRDDNLYGECTFTGSAPTDSEGNILESGGLRSQTDGKNCGSWYTVEPGKQYQEGRCYSDESLTHECLENASGCLE